MNGLIIEGRFSFNLETNNERTANNIITRLTGEVIVAIESPTDQSIVNTSIAKPKNQIDKPIIAKKDANEIFSSDTLYPTVRATLKSISSTHGVSDSSSS